jgi:hypothetical protein
MSYQSFFTISSACERRLPAVTSLGVKLLYVLNTIYTSVEVKGLKSITTVKTKHDSWKKTIR